MNKRYALKLGILSLALLAMAAFAPSASASVIGHLVVGICSAGGVVVGSASIDWAPGSPSACLSVGLGTNVTSVGDGSLTPSFSGIATINDLTLPPPSSGDAGFMSFTGTGVNLLFNLAPSGGLGPGVGTDCNVDPAIGFSCSPPGSPFVLTNTATGTSVTLLANGTITDSNGSLSIWQGSFTTQIDGVTPSAIEATISRGGTIQSSFSGEFDVVPEPVSMTLIGGGLIALIAMRRRKRA